MEAFKRTGENPNRRKKPTRINRHIIKYYVVTEHTLVHGFDMEADSWRVRSVSSGPKAVCFNILTSKNNTSLLVRVVVYREEGALHICTVRQITRQLFPRKLLSQKYRVMIERERRRREGPARGKRLAEFSFYPSSFYTICCQKFVRIMTGRPGFCFSSHHRSVLSFFSPFS